MNLITPRLETLPTSQQALWPQLGAVGDNFVLYGGTALSLRVGGRQSIDFDFFTDGPIDVNELTGRLPFLSGAALLSRGPSDATFSTKGTEPIKISFFGDLAFGRVDEPSKFSDNGVIVAGLLDLAAQKAKVVQQRATAKDYIDLATLLRSGITLERALGAAQMLFPELSPAVTLRALTFFEDGDLAQVPPQIRTELVAAVSSLRQIPLVPKIASSLLPHASHPSRTLAWPTIDKTQIQRSKDHDMEL
jgi:hypothetical protein